MARLSETECRAICERAGLDPSKYRVEIFAGTYVNLTRLRPGELAARGDGKSFHLRLTPVQRAAESGSEEQ